jgi:hypothetical protein
LHTTWLQPAACARATGVRIWHPCWHPSLLSAPQGLPKRLLVLRGAVEFWLLRGCYLAPRHLRTLQWLRTTWRPEGGRWQLAPDKRMARHFCLPAINEQPQRSTRSICTLTARLPPCSRKALPAHRLLLPFLGRRQRVGRPDRASPRWPQWPRLQPLAAWQCTRLEPAAQHMVHWRRTATTLEPAIDPMFERWM